MQAGGKEYYFRNENGFKRCHREAQAGDERAQEHWALYMSIRMKA